MTYDHNYCPCCHKSPCECNIPELLPCPFCNGNNIGVWDEGFNVYQVGCEDCDIQGPPAASKVEAANRWNNRPCLTLATTGITDVVRCIGNIVDGEIWAGRARCRVCDSTWVACTPFGTNTFECPACGCMEGRKEFNDAEEAAGRIATALVDILGISAKNAVDTMKGISQVIPEGNIRDKWEESLRFLAMENKG